MSSSDVTTRKPGSASDWLPCLIYSPSADNLNNFIAKRRAFEENRELTPQEFKSRFWCMLDLWGSKPQSATGKFLAEAMYS